MKNKLLTLLAAVALLGATPAFAQEDGKDKTGTDPRDFSSKIMPYYTHTELNNGVEVDQLNLFGMYAFNGDLAMTYDLPVWKDAEGPLGGEETGIGDLGLRLFYKPEFGKGESSTHMFGAEFVLPTATNETTFNDFGAIPFNTLGEDTLIVSPMYTFVKDVKLLSPGFIAMMNFYDFDIDKGDQGRDFNRYRGRWFIMQPLSRPGPGLLDGIYLLPEIQPIYDFEADEDEFSLWAAPEIGKMLPAGAAYLKPGFGVINEADTDRDWTLEVGFRYFF